MSEDNGSIVEEGKPLELGKFKSVDALMHAYEELEAEFTRRSQRLKTLEQQAETAKEPKKDSVGQAAENPEKDPVGQVRCAEGCVPEQGEKSGDALFDAVMDNREVRQRVIGEYLNSLKGVPLLMGSGQCVSAPKEKPKSFAEAGNLALGYFKSNS